MHAEAATGNTNPVAEIGEVVRAHGALFMLDAVASVGAEPLLPDAWGVDLCVIGAQKAMGGPGRGVGRVGERAGVGADGRESGGTAAVVPLAAGLEGALDRRWPHARCLHAPAQLEMLALEACVERIEAEGLDTVIARHAVGGGGHPGGRARAGRRP